MCGLISLDNELIQKNILALFLLLKNMALILGIDPGTTTVGFAVISIENNIRTIVTYGVIHTTPKVPQSQKLLEIATDLDNIITSYHITHGAVEKLFFSTNLKTGIDVAQGR